MEQILFLIHDKLLKNAYVICPFLVYHRKRDGKNKYCVQLKNHREKSKNDDGQTTTHCQELPTNLPSGFIYRVHTGANNELF